MSIVSLDDCLDFLDIDAAGTFTVNAQNDVLVLTSDQGAANIDVPDGTYEGAGLATALQTGMNADATLTGGAITFVVSYSTTTEKFTLDATAGHTIGYTHSGSDAGLLFGFTEDAAASQTITSDTAEPGDPSDTVKTIHDGVEGMWKLCTDYTFESTTYTLEEYSGTGDTIMYLRQKPIISIAQISIGRQSAIKIKNTSTDGSSAYVKVDVAEAKLVLTVLGGANADATDVEFATYATLSEVVTQINAVGKGWVASIYDTDLNDILSTQLVTVEGLQCGSRANTTATDEHLYIPNTPISEFRINARTGELYRPAGWSAGFQNIIITSTLGYSDDDMPNDIKNAILYWVKAIYNQYGENGLGVISFSSGGTTLKYIEEMPDKARLVLDKRARVTL